MNSLSEGYGLSKTAVIEERILLNPEQIQKRIRELARQISEDYRGKTCCAVAVLENGFMFMTDLVRNLEVPVICQFIKPHTHELWTGGASRKEINYSPSVEVRNQHVLLIEGLVHSGITTEFWNSMDAICSRDEWTLWGTPNCGKGQPQQVMGTGHGAAPARFKNVKVGSAYKGT